MKERSKYSLKQKLLAVKAIVAGLASCSSEAGKLGCAEYTVRRWLDLYRQHGVTGLKLRPGSYSGQFKVKVVRHMLKNDLSLVRTATFFGIPKPHTVGFWLRKYECGGAAGLQHEARGRKKTMMAKKVKLKSNAILTPAEQQLATLQAENEYLRAENALLKKLDALVQEEEAARRSSKRPKPSGN